LVTISIKVSDILLKVYYRRLYRAEVMAVLSWFELCLSFDTHPNYNGHYVLDYVFI
jgi:hypothetical protein